MDSIREEIYRLLRRRTGLDAASLGDAVMERALCARMASCAVGGMDQYRQLLADSPAQLQELVEAIVVPETWFFRTPAAFAQLARYVTEEWMRAHPNLVLRVLSLPCSTGEEAYSIAMTLRDAGLGPHQFVVDGMDISARALERARAAIYRDYSFRSRDLAFRDRYFCPAEDGYALRDEIRALVRFEQGNVLELQADLCYHIIFCRNLLIYFDRAAQCASIVAIARAMSGDGLIFVGPSEAFCTRGAALIPAGRTDAFAFRKVTAKPRQPDSLVASRAVDSSVALAIAVRPSKAASSQPAAPARPTTLPREKTALAAPPRPCDCDLEQVARLADAGRLAQAQVLCEANLASAGASARGYYLMGLLRDSQHDRAQAIEFYRKALYLEPNHTDAMLQLALLLGQQGKDAQAGRMRTRARRAQERAAK